MYFETKNIIIGVMISAIVLLLFLNYKRIYKVDTVVTRKWLQQTQKYIFICLAIIAPLAISLCIGNVVSTEDVINHKYEKAFLDKASKELTKKHPNKLYSPNKTYTHKDEFSKKGAIDSVTKLLNDVKKKQSSKEIKTRFEELSKDDNKLTAIIDKKVIDRYYLPDSLNTDEMKVNTTMALLSIVSLMDKGDIQLPSSVKLDDVVFDKHTKTAYVPLDIYIGRFTGVGFEMVYENKTWKLNPYSLMRSIQLSDFLSSRPQQSQQSQESQPKEQK